MIDSQTKALLERNLILSSEMKSRIVKASPELQQSLKPSLLKLDELQITMVKKALSKNPHFLSELQSGLTHDVMQYLSKKEQDDHRVEIANAESELEQLLANI